MCTHSGQYSNYLRSYYENEDWESTRSPEAVDLVEGLRRGAVFNEDENSYNGLAIVKIASAVFAQPQRLHCWYKDKDEDEDTYDYNEIPITCRKTEYGKESAKELVVHRTTKVLLGHDNRDAY